MTTMILSEVRGEHQARITSGTNSLRRTLRRDNKRDGYWILWGVYTFAG